VSRGTVSLPTGSVGNAAIASGLDATKITTGTFGVGAFGGCNLSTTGTLVGGASTLGTLSCTTVTTNNNNITAGSGSITSGQHNPTTAATYDLGASATAWKSAYLSSDLTAGGSITASNGLTVSGGTVSLPASSVVNAAVASGLDATKITKGTFGVGAFGGCNITTTGTLGAGASTLGTLSCTTITTNNSSLTVGSGSITSGQHNPTTSATYDLGASGTAWRSAYLSSNLTVGGAITGSNGLALPGQYTCSLPVTFDTVANGVKDIATFACTSTTSGQISFDISVILSQANTSTTKRYLISTRYNVTTGAWQRCIPLSAYSSTGTTDNYELQTQSTAAPAVIIFRLVHSVNTVASTPTVNITATYAQNDVTTFANLVGNAQYTDASWATYSFVSSAALTQVAGQVGVGTLAPSAKFHVAGGSAQFDSNVAVTSALSISNLTATGTVSLPASSITNVNIASGVDASKITSGTLATAQIPNLNASNITSSVYSVGTFASSISASNLGNTQYALLSGSTTNNAQLALVGTAGSYSSSAAVGDVVLQNVGGNLILQSSNGAAAIYVESTNLVGINNASLSYNLNVTGTMRATRAVTTDNLTCGSIGTQGNSISAGTVACTGINPGSAATYDLGTSSITWRNAYLSRTITGTTFTGLPQKYWNAVTQGVASNATRKYYKIGSILDVNNAGNGGGIRVCGGIGGFGTVSHATIDVVISSRDTFGIRGTAIGNPSGASGNDDLAVYVETNGSFTIYVTSLQFCSWDLSVESCGYNTTVLEPSSTATASPTSTLITGSVLSVLDRVTDDGAGATHFNKFTWSSNATNLTWALGGASNSGSISCGPITCTDLTPSGTTSCG
jgi:hypothetical protein